MVAILLPLLLQHLGSFELGCLSFGSLVCAAALLGVDKTLACPSLVPLDALSGPSQDDLATAMVPDFSVYHQVVHIDPSPVLLPHITPAILASFKLDHHDTLGSRTFLLPACPASGQMKGSGACARNSSGSREVEKPGKCHAEELVGKLTAPVIFDLFDDDSDSKSV